MPPSGLGPVSKDEKAVPKAPAPRVPDDAEDVHYFARFDKDVARCPSCQVELDSRQLKL